MRFFFLIAFSFFYFGIHAQSGAEKKMSLQQCEAAFLRNNYSLLAAQYNIDAQQALVIQARLWENPYFSAEVNFYNPDRERFFDAGVNGQKQFEIQQLIHLGGKKKNEVGLARSQAKMAEYEYLDVLRNIRFQLRKSFYSVYYDNQALEALSAQLNGLDTLIAAYDLQAQKGNVPLKDVVRLQSLYLKLKNEYTGLFNAVLEEQINLSLITGIDSLIVPLPLPEEAARYDAVKPLTPDSLLALALQNRPDIGMAAQQVDRANWDLKWQKSLAVPDLTLGGFWDRQSGAFNRELNLTIGVPLVLWNRNQGNIRLADAKLKTALVQKDMILLELRSEISAVYRKYLEATTRHVATGEEARRNFELVNKGVFQNFQQRNISLLEFTDFVESYNESMNELNRIRKTRIIVYEEINYLTSANLF